MCFSASIPNSTIAAVCAPRSRLSTKRSQFTLMRLSIGVISLYKENHRQCRWYQKALAMHRKNILL